MLQTLKAGGLLIIPILICGVFATYIIIERFIYFISIFFFAFGRKIEIVIDIINNLIRSTEKKIKRELDIIIITFKKKRLENSFTIISFFYFFIRRKISRTILKIYQFIIYIFFLTSKMSLILRRYSSYFRMI